MKVNFPARRTRGLTRFDVLAAFLLVIFLFILLIALILPVRHAAHLSDERMNCLMNLKQISIAQRIWANENGGSGRPLSILLETNDGTLGLNGGQMGWLNMIGMSNIIGCAKILQCPADKMTPITTNDFGFEIRISYFLNLEANEGYPQMILSGDDNLAINGTPLKPGIFELSSKMSVLWAPERHGLANNIGLADGSVEQQSSAGLQNAIQYSFNGVPSLTNRIAIP
jgi:prepilin-type processing-associated H-X9-DG protein